MPGRRWMVAVGSAPGEATLAEQGRGRKRARMAELARDPALQEVLAAFPGATLVDVRAAQRLARAIPTSERRANRR